MSEEQVPEATEDTRDYESEARNMGWHDPEDDDFKGDRENALDAQAFVEKGENELPVLKSNLRKLQSKVAQQDSDREEFKNFMKTQNENIKAEYDAKLREAVSDGDTDRYDLLKKNEPKTSVKEENQLATDFASRNDWYGVDAERTLVVQAADRSLAALREVLPKEDYLSRLEEEVERLYPTKTAHNTVTPSRRSPKVGKSRTFESMPAEFRETCKRLEKEYNCPREDYVKNYYDDLEKKS